MAKNMFAKKRSLTPILWLLILILAGGFVIYKTRTSDAEPQSDQQQQEQNSTETQTPPATPQPAPVASVPTPPVAQPAPVQPAPLQPTTVETAPEPTPQPPAPATVSYPGDELYAQGCDAWQEEDVIGARGLLSQAVAAGLSVQDDAAAREILNQCADLWLFSRRVFEDDQYCTRYTVKGGDLLVNIGQDHGVPYELLMRLNGIRRPELLQANQTLKVVQGPFRLLVDRQRCIMSVCLGDVIVRTYPVGLGAPGRDTPLGLWRSSEGRKQLNPAWTDPDTGEHYYADDPQNPLGVRWIGLEGVSGEAEGRIGFGIHGTINPEEIGRAVSRGCIRLHNRDVEELYDMVSDGVTEVLVY